MGWHEMVFLVKSLLLSVILGCQLSKQQGTLSLYVESGAIVIIVGGTGRGMMVSSKAWKLAPV